MMKLIKRFRWPIVFLCWALLLFIMIRIYTYNYGGVVKSLPRYDDCKKYYSEGFQDYTDYVEYYYEDIDIEDLEKNKYLEYVDEEDISTVRSFLGRYNIYAFQDPELMKVYDFSPKQIEVGDYYYIEAYKAPVDEDEYDYVTYSNINIYYFDVDAKTMYYFHNNI